MKNTIKFIVYTRVMPAINRLLRLISLKLVTVRTPNRNFTEFFQHLATLSFSAKTVIDVGVGNGTHSLYAANPNADFYLIEPVPDNQGTVAAIAKRLGARFFNVAAGATHGDIAFNMHADVTGSSLFRQLEGEALDGQRITVPMRTLDELIPADIARPCVLKIDTQGAELDVIRGGAATMQRVDVAILEVSFHQFREGAAEVHEVIQAMTGIGFRCYDILEGHFRSVDNALAQVDIVFVRDDSALRKVRTFFDQTQVKAYMSTGDV